jgi:hypothetical protein
LTPHLKLGSPQADRKESVKTETVQTGARWKPHKCCGMLALLLAIIAMDTAADIRLTYKEEEKGKIKTV